MTVEMKVIDNTAEEVRTHLLNYFEVSNLSKVNKAFTKHLYEGKEDPVLKDELEASTDCWFVEDPHSK